MRLIDPFQANAVKERLPFRPVLNGLREKPFYTKKAASGNGFFISEKQKRFIIIRNAKRKRYNRFIDR